MNFAIITRCVYQNIFKPKGTYKNQCKLEYNPITLNKSIFTRTNSVYSMTTSTREINLGIEIKAYSLWKSSLISSVLKSSYYPSRVFTTGAQHRSHYSTIMSENEPKEISFPVPYGKIAGKVWNDDGSVPVLCLHGWQDNAGSFDSLAPLLPKHLRLVAIDFPGHGRSSHKPLGFSQIFMDYAITVDRVVKHYGWEKVIILGHSMGAGVGMLYAGTRPSVVQSLIMIDLIKPIDTPAHDQPQKTADALDAILKAEKKMLNSRRPSYSFEELLQRAMKSHEGSLGEVGVRSLLRRGSEQQEDGTYSFTYDLQIRLPSLLSPTLEQQLAYASSLRCRLLLLKAKDGPFYESKEAYEEIINKYRSASPEFVYLTVPGTHHTHLDTPQHVVPHIEDFLAPHKLREFAAAPKQQTDAH